MRRFRSPVWIVFSLLMIAPLIASTQYGDCEAIVKSALDATNEVCSQTGRNEACYGHFNLDAQPQPGAGPLVFDQAGDRVDVTLLDSLRLSPMDLTQDAWGVALLKLQADISDNQPDANVSMLLFGDVQIQNAVLEPVLMDATVAGTRNINVRKEPSTQGFVLTTLRPGATVTATGRSADGSWIAVDLPANGGSGWVRSRLLEGAGDFATLNEVRPQLAGYGPMQAFYLKTGSDQPSCADAKDGILVQTPEGVAEVSLWINEVRIRLGSTAFIQASPSRKMVVQTVEGEAHVEALGVEQDVPAGTTVDIPMDENLAPSAPPSQPEAYVAEEVADLPVGGLEREIEVAPPLEVTDEPTVEASLVPSDTPTATPTDTDIPPTEVPPVPPTDTPIVLSLTPPEATKEPPPTDPPPPPTEVPTDTPTP